MADIPAEVIERERKKVFREMENLKIMVENWKKSYLADTVYPGHDAHFPVAEFMNPDGDWGFLVRDLWQECDEYVFPYAKRFQACGYISSSEFRVFMGELQEVVYDFGAELIQLYCEWWFATDLDDAERELYLAEFGKYPDENEEEFKKIWSVFAPTVLRLSLAGRII